MRLLHTSDWHLGLNEHNLDRRPDHDHVLKQIGDIARTEKVDVILHTGDLFDRDYPGLDVLKYGWQHLEELAAIAPVAVLCGNHDSPKLFELMGMILGSRLRLHFLDLGSLHAGPNGILRIPTADGEQIVIGAVPFVKHANVVRSFIEEGISRSTILYAEFVGNIESQVGEWINAGYDSRHDIRIFAAHLLVADAVPSLSEYKFHMESDFATRAQRIPIADYVAFGHIHKPQVIPGVLHGRYAGSPVPIDFGERADEKCIFLVTGKPGQRLEINPFPLDIGRKLVQIEGTLDQIALSRETWRGNIAKVIVDIDEPIAQLDARVRDLLVDTEVVSVAPRYLRPTAEALSVVSEDAPAPTIPELFATYLTSSPNTGDPERVKRYFNLLLDAVVRDDSELGFPDLDEVLK